MSVPVVSAHEEYFALNAFWWFARSSQADVFSRLSLLQHMVNLKIARPSGWDTARVRSEFNERWSGRGSWNCFCCENFRLPRPWHHIIQVQHGGSNDSRNLVAVCEMCHSRLHPWLPNTDDLGGWQRWNGKDFVRARVVREGREERMRVTK